MRTPRIVILAFFTLAILTLLLFSSRQPAASEPVYPTTAGGSDKKKGGFFSAFSFSAPLALFPPNAIISLTDDNTTSFLARPAAFGPLLPPSGLSGQLWIGSGFGDQAGGKGPLYAGAEGELGCSDVPGWSARNGIDSSGAPKSSKSTKNRKRSESIQNDGTDDYLQGLPAGSAKLPNSPSTQPHTVIDTDHADIQSIQEGAEIAGKVVLLSRGGCGFLEKVLWTQRRGGIALIVGDNMRGGPLIQMYAHGDTSNVTIPSVFTSHTTAHLLSSLIPPGTYIEDTVDENGNIVTKVQQTGKSGKRKGKKPSVTPKLIPTTASQTGKASSKNGGDGLPTSKSDPSNSSWLDRLLGRRVDSTVKKDDKGAGAVGEGQIGESAHGSTKKSPKQKPSKAEKQKGSSGVETTSDDDFVIGVQDWRDPDVIGKTEQIDGSDSSELASGNKAGKAGKGHKSQSAGSGKGDGGTKATSESTKSGLINTIFGEDDDNDFEQLQFGNLDEEYEDYADEHEHEGLWVTLTQTNSATPFFDTLLVLVVSPLITLTVVYALLLVRSRIRRRRWRAPKSIVEQLPVRTYHTLRSPSPSGSRQPSPGASSPATPLLQRPRPRSRTTSGLPEPGNLSRSNSNNLEAPRPRNEHEKHGGSEWKKYMGRQSECVVCLEEYVDGVSRVMSLPCGHEFHVECM
jgi:hypothetical protein